MVNHETHAFNMMFIVPFHWNSFFRFLFVERIIVSLPAMKLKDIVAKMLRLVPDLQS